MSNVKTRVDRISALSNAVLVHILSFLRTRKVVRTSILSRRWKNLWTKVPVLDFSCLDLPLTPFFKSFVYKALVLNDAPVLHVFRLDHLNIIEDSNVNSWIWSVMQRNISEINLRSSGFKEKRLVTVLFSSEKLMALKLNGKLVIPSVVASLQHLPKLELLHLTDVVFEQCSTLPALLSICPRLKELLLSDCLGQNDVHIQSSSLRKLELFSNEDTQKFIVLEAPELEYISLKDDSSCYDIKVAGPVDHLVEATFNGPWKEHGCGMIDLLSKSSNLKTLKLTLPMPSLKHGGAQFPVFRNLSCLELAYGAGPFVLQMLEHAPDLTSLILHELDCMDDSWGSMDYWLPLPKDTPKCLSRSLQFVKITEFCGFGSHLKLAEYLLKYAALLKVMKIYPANKDRECEMDGLMNLFDAHTATAYCEFSISFPKK